MTGQFLKLPAQISDYAAHFSYAQANFQIISPNTKQFQIKVCTLQCTIFFIHVCHWRIYLGVACPAHAPPPSPPRVQILSFRHTKFLKRNHLGSPRPSYEVHAPLQEILDPPLYQGGHSTGKTGNLVITFSRQKKHRKFRYNTGKIWTTQGL